MHFYKISWIKDFGLKLPIDYEQKRKIPLTSSLINYLKSYDNTTIFLHFSIIVLNGGEKHLLTTSSFLGINLELLCRILMLFFGESYHIFLLKIAIDLIFVVSHEILSSSVSGRRCKLPGFANFWNVQPPAPFSA